MPVIDTLVGVVELTVDRVARIPERSFRLVQATAGAAVMLFFAAFMLWPATWPTRYLAACFVVLFVAVAACVVTGGIRFLTPRR